MQYGDFLFLNMTRRAPHAEYLKNQGNLGHFQVSQHTTERFVEAAQTVSSPSLDFIRLYPCHRDSYSVLVA